MSEVLHFPDIWSGDTGINFASSYLVACKATEGTGYFDPEYPTARQFATRNNVFFMGYHFLHHGNVLQQADYAYKMVGPSVPLAIDVEPYLSSRPTPYDAEMFIDEYRRLGGKIFITYYPFWYWQLQGSPDLAGLRERSQWLWSSNYPPAGYTDNGPGWNGYGGLQVAIWQYSSSIPYGGIPEVDFNAFRGTGKQPSLAGVRAEFQHLVTTGVLTSAVSF